MVEDVLTFVHHGRRKLRTGKKQKGEKTGRQLYDGTAFHALTLLADGLAGYAVSRAFRWFEYVLPGRLNFPRWSALRAWSGKRMDEFPEVKEYLEASEEVMYAAFLRSNFYDITPEFIKDSASIGTVTATIEEDVKEGRIIFDVPHFREGYIAENRFKQVDTFYREVDYTLKQCVEKFGLDTMKEADPRFVEKFTKNRYQELELLHATYPRSDYDPEAVNSKNKPHASLWVLKAGKKLLLESGYNEKQSVTWRWRKNSEEWYGRGACWDALVEVMKGHQQARTNMIAAQKIAEPPMIAPAGLRGQVGTGPKGWTWLDKMTTENIPQMLDQKINLPFTLEMEDRTREAIKEYLFVDFFLMLSNAALQNANLTATQVLEMAGEKAVVLGPRIGRMETEAMNPIHDRVWEIERRAGRIPEPPEILQEYSGGNIEVDYMGPLSQAQKKLFKSQGIRAGLEALEPLAAIHPQVKYVVEPIETARILLTASGFPSKALRTDNEVQEAMAAAAEREQLQQALAQGTEIAKVLPAAGKAVEEGSPLKMLTEDAGAGVE